ncbi:MAG: hypothetical protein ACKO34_04295 [Vampirovibrionales bacterium]
MSSVFHSIGATPLAPDASLPSLTEASRLSQDPDPASPLTKLLNQYQPLNAATSQGGLPRSASLTWQSATPSEYRWPTDARFEPH